MSNYDDLYYDTYYDGEAPEEKSKAAMIFGVVKKTVVVSVILVIMGILVYRMWEIRTPSDVGKFLWTAEVKEAYDRLNGTKTTVSADYSGEDFSFEREDLTKVTVTKKNGSADYETLNVSTGEYYSSVGFRVFTNNTGSYTITDENGKETDVICSGYYENADSPVDRALMIDHVYFVPSAKTVQLTFRYRTDSLKKLNGRSATERGDFLISLKDDKERYYTDYYSKTASRGVYRYMTIVFTGVDLSEVLELSLVAEYIDKENAYQSISIYVYDASLKLAAKEIDVGKGSEKVVELPFYKRKED